jgi:hypothetical protein
MPDFEKIQAWFKKSFFWTDINAIRFMSAIMLRCCWGGQVIGGNEYAVIYIVDGALA